jgi:hypothetical protein
MADTSLEKVVFYRKPHQVIVYGFLANSFKELDGFVIIAFDSGKVGNFKKMFICESKGKSSLESCL